MRVLVGHTGYVGSTLLRQQRFDACYNSRNIGELEGKTVDEIWCAGISAAKWIANRDPEADKAKIDRLSDVLKSVRCKFFLLISTIDVYPNPVEVDEATMIDVAGHHAYGANRLSFESFVRLQFPNALIVRLPALFGFGLRKNIVFDLLNRNALEAINRDTTFQWYDMSRLADDVALIRKQPIDLVNFAVEPLGTNEILDRFFPEIDIAAPERSGARYDFRSMHAQRLFGRQNYFWGKDKVVEQMDRFVRAEKDRLACS